MVVDYDMDMALPKNIPTHEQSSTKNWTILDNIFASRSMMAAFTRCNVEPAQRPPLADHLPIISEIDMGVS
jgi:exonuclease III